MADVTDKMIGGFRILAEIKGASGSQGQVFKAVCENPPFAGIEPGTVVALKAMAVHDEDGQVWAKLEKRTGELVLLSHPNVVKYYGCFSEPGTFNDTHAIVQEYLEGETLKQRLARCPSGLDADEALHVTEAALAGLEYTASKGIVHRDIKPANIFLCLDKDGAITGVKLIDFEIARQEGGTTTSASGNLVGSFDYMSPDFTNSTFRGDEQSDVFSMGVVMHEAITGRTPYQRIEGSSGRADFAFLSRWVRLHVDGTNPIKISSRANRLLAHSDEVLAKALAPLTQDRYASFAEFHAGLKALRYRDLRNGNNAYRILQIIGKGGFGEVFKARLKGGGRLVAIKHLLKETYAERFYREAKIMARLDDPCFVHFVDFFVVRHAGRREAFLVMDFLPGMPGSSLRDAIKRAGGAALPFRETLLAFARFAHGLCVLHARGIFHRDIKPSNLYFPEGHPERAAIMDLGIARDVHGSITSGQVPGTLDYMPPEVVLTENRGEAGMDIYALGLCLYEALSGKTAYPRLPQGPAAIASFLARANIKAMPDLSDPSVVENAPLHDLLVRMTHPELSERITDTSAVERALADLAGVAQMPEAPVEEEYAAEGEEETRTDALFESAVEVETRPAPQDNPFTSPADPKTIRTIETIQQTVQTKPPPPVLDIGRGSEAVDQRKEERQHERRERILRGLALAAVAVVACLGAAWACRGWFVADANAARKEAEAVVRAYAGRGLEDGRSAKGKWLKRWMPRQGHWLVDLDRASFAACTNRIHAEEVKLLDVAAESAAVEVESSYSNTKNATAECDRMFEEWRKEWAQQCSPTKFSELEERIKKAQYGKYSRAGVQLTMRYQIVTNTLETCDRLAEMWKKKRPEGFPDDEFNKLVANVEKAREKRMKEDRKREGDRARENDRRAAESALAEVVKSYDAGTAVGDREAATWRKSWKGKLDDRVYSEMDAQIATTRTKRAEIEREQRVQVKKKEFEGDCRRIAAGYRDDSSDKAKVDAEYDEWVKKWNADRDVPTDCRARFEKEVKDAKTAREKRIAQADEKVKAAAAAALQDVIGAYDDSSKELDVGDEKAKAWLKEWKEKLSDDAYSQMNAQIASAREKRVNHDEWEKKQRILASKTNEVESVRVALVKDYGNDSGAKKADIDSRFDRWATNWEADEVLRKELPNWFAGRKRTVEEAKKACEARIAEEKRNQLVAAKTNDVVTVRLQLEGAYKTDTSDKASADRKFTEWMLKWSADADLPPGWFADQMKPVEREKSAREVRDERRRKEQERKQQEEKAGNEVDSVCEIYRSDGVAAGDGSRKMWNNYWTNTLETAVFRSLSAKMDEAREAREKADREEEDRRKAAEAAAAAQSEAAAAALRRKAKEEEERRNAEAEKARQEAEAEKVRRKEEEARRKAEEEAARQKAERERAQRIAANTNEVVAAGVRFVDGYKDDASDKAQLDKEFEDWVTKWKAEAELPPGWFAEQRLAVEREKIAREGRDAVATALKKAREKDEAARKADAEAARAKERAEAAQSAAAKEAELRKVKEVVDAEEEAARQKAGRERAQRIAANTNEVVAASVRFVDGYKDDASDKTQLDKGFEDWVAKWKDEVELPPGWFAEQKLVVQTAKIEREVRDKEKERVREEKERMARDARTWAESVCKTYRETSREAGDIGRDEWTSRWTNILDAEVFGKLSKMIDDARRVRIQADKDKEEEEWRRRVADKTNQVASVCVALVNGYADDSVKKSEIDERFDRWTNEWGSDADLRKSLPNWFAGQKKTVEVAKHAREERVKQRMDKIETKRKQLEADYKDDSSDKAKLDDDFKKCRGNWESDADIPPEWLGEQARAVENEKAAREKRDEDRAKRAAEQARAREQAVGVIDAYRKTGFDAGEARRDVWMSYWKDVLDAATFRELEQSIDEAQAKRKARDKKEKEEREAERQAQIAKKQRLVKSEADDLVRAYGNTAIAREETDRSFAAWREKCEADADLPLDPVAEHRREVEKARDDRMTRDTAEKNRKAAWDDVIRVRKAYESGVDAGNAERQVWDGKWKSVLDEAAYKEIAVVIDQALAKAEAGRQAALKKKEEERRRVAGEKLEKEIQEALKVDENHVEGWRRQLEEAESKISKGKSGGVLDEQKAASLLGEVNVRKQWVVGVVKNQSQQEIDVAGRSIASGQRECFVLEGGMPEGGLTVKCAGYRPLSLDKDILDGSVVAVGSGKWKLVPVPRARVQIPALEGGVTCLVDGREREGDGEFELAAGRHEYVYRLKDHEDQKGSFAVGDGEVKKLPEPGKWRADRALEELFTRKLNDIENCLEVKDGELCLRTYHEIWKKGYRLTEDDKANIGDAFDICKKDYEAKLHRAIVDPRFKEEDVRRWWEGVLALYNDLTSKR